MRVYKTQRLGETDFHRDTEVSAALKLPLLMLNRCLGVLLADCIMHERLGIKERGKGREKEGERDEKMGEEEV